MEEMRCIGCGAVLQTEDKNEIGYTPKAAFEKGVETGELYCQRCFRLRHYNEIQPVSISDDAFTQLLHEVGESDALVVNVVDLFDFNGSIIPGLPRFVSGNDILLVGNKKDVLPRSVKLGKIKQWLTERSHEEGLRPVDVTLTSFKDTDSIKALIQTIERYRKGRDVYVVGVTNVGKSSLINAIIQELTGNQSLITASRFPGTTLDKIEIPLEDGRYIFDTPGIIHRYQMAHYLAEKDLKYSSPKKEIKPRVYQLNAKQTLFFGALARFDLVTSERQGVTAFFDNDLMIHRTKLEGADAFYEQHRGKLLTPDVREQSGHLVSHTFSITGKTDIVFSGLGWVRVTKKAQVTVWAPEGVAVVQRQAII